MINELVTKVSPVFGRLVTPPCMKGDKWTGCIFPEDIQRRLDGRDHNLPVCPLFIGRDKTKMGQAAREQWNNGTLRLSDQVRAEADRRGVFWQRDPWLGTPMRVTGPVDPPAPWACDECGGPGWKAAGPEGRCPEHGGA
jgi:hypothetical protein